MTNTNLNYEDKVLIKLRRTYSKDETVKALNKKIEILEMEKGQDLSEIDYLKHELKTLEQKLRAEFIKEIQEHPMFKEQRKLIKNRGEKITELKLEIRKLQNDSRNTK